jgi:DNA-binding GntR family transcriptional regulator
MTSAIDTRSLVDQVHEFLLTRIISGAIQYGDVLSIKQIASQLQVSTMPVREAVKRLECESVVSIKPRSFCRVRKPSRKMIWEVYELRMFLERYAVTKSLGDLPRDSLQRLHAIVKRMRALQSQPDTASRAQRAIVLDREFHVEICGLARNDFLNAFYRQLSLLVNMTLIHEKTYQRLKRGWAGVHAEIVRCVEREPARALEALQRHFDNVTNLLRVTAPPETEGADGGEPDRSGRRKLAEHTAR